MAFTTALSLMRASIYAKMGVDAVWTPAGGGAVALRALPVMPDQIVEVQGLGRQVTPSRLINVRASETVATGAPAKGDRIVIDNETFTVLATPRKLDNRRLEWTIALGST